MKHESSITMPAASNDNDNDIAQSSSKIDDPITTHSINDDTINDVVIENLLKKYKTNNSTMFELEEFREDISRFMYVKRLLKRYSTNDKLNVRLLLNHLVILHNCFDTYATRVLQDSIEPELHPYLYGVLNVISYLEPAKQSYADTGIQQKIESEIRKYTQ